MEQRVLTRTERQVRRARWHGATMAAWGVWVVVFTDTAANPHITPYGAIFPFWVWGVIVGLAGIVVAVLAQHPRAVDLALPGRIALLCWLALATLFVMGNYRTIEIPLYIGLAYNAYAFLVRE